MRIILTGGGTGGHVTPLIAIIEEISRNFSENSDRKRSASSRPSLLQNFSIKRDLLYIGSNSGPEKSLIPKLNVPFKGIYCGKLRRYFSFKNFIDFFKIPIGIIQALIIIKKFNPDIIFSKGGYVAFPVVYAAHLLKKKIISHESDVVPGLANRLTSKYSDKILLSYEESKKYFKNKEKLIVIGNPVRESVLSGSAKKGYEFTGFNDKKPVLLVIGGSQGADRINKLIFNNLNQLLKLTQIVHICGKGKQLIATGSAAVFAKQIPHIPGYMQYEYLNEELKDIYQITSLAVSRAGSNTLSEFLAMSIPSILIPLPLKASRGEQMENALAFGKMNGSILVPEDENLEENFMREIEKILKNKEILQTMKNNLNKEKPGKACDKIVKLLLQIR